jgi:hypothetical protein
MFLKSPSGKRLNHSFVDITPTPIFAPLKRPHDGVFGFFEVLGGMPIFGGIAAADVAANLAEAQVDPRIAHLQALFTSIGIRGWVLYLVQV